MILQRITLLCATSDDPAVVHVDALAERLVEHARELAPVAFTVVRDEVVVDDPAVPEGDWYDAAVHAVELQFLKGQP